MGKGLKAATRELEEEGPPGASLRASDFSKLSVGGRGTRWRERQRWRWVQEPQVPPRPFWVPQDKQLKTSSSRQAGL